ncbi:hypothetical protein IT575_02350 [bacterium]|nr:hypothetical protein [bacterium]
MIKKLLIGGILGAVIMFMWLGLAWSTWHLSQFRQIPDDRALMGEIALRNMDSGIYYYPPMPDRSNPEAVKAHEEAFSAGPVISFMAFQKKGGSMPLTMIRGFLITLFSVSLVCWLLLRAAPALPGYFQRVGFCSAVGLVVALSGPLTFGNFFWLPQMHQFLELFDQLVGWTLVGLLLAWVCRAGNPMPAAKAST